KSPERWTLRSADFRLRGGCIPCRAMPRSAHRGSVNPRDLRGLGQLITQRSLVQIQPPQPRTTRGQRTQQPLAPFVYPDFTPELVQRHASSWFGSAADWPAMVFRVEVVCMATRQQEIS